MAIFYVRSTDGNNVDSGATWALAKATLAGAFSACAAGDTVYVSQVHAETQASAMNLGGPGSSANPVKVVCVNDGAEPPTALATSATITTTGNSAFDIYNNTFYYGITFSCGSGAVSAQTKLASSGGNSRFENCKFIKAGTVGNTAAFRLADLGSGRLELNNCTFKFGATNDSLSMAGAVVWKNSVAVDGAGSLPTSLFYNATGNAPVILDGVDFSAMTGSPTLWNAAVLTAARLIVYRNCKFSSGTIPMPTPNNPESGEHFIINSDSGATNYLHSVVGYYGRQDVETSIVRTEGATDGTTPISWKIITTANSKWAFPFESIPMAVWNNSTAANVTVTVYGVWGGGAVPNNDEIWMEVSYMGSSATPIATFNTANGTADFLAAASAQGSDSSTWGGSTTKFKMSVTLSAPQPAMKGLIYVTVKAAKPSTTFYVDPRIVLS